MEAAADIEANKTSIVKEKAMGEAMEEVMEEVVVEDGNFKCDGFFPYCSSSNYAKRDMPEFSLAFICDMGKGVRCHSFAIERLISEKYLRTDWLSLAVAP
jgi:hypothetical protein